MNPIIKQFLDLHKDNFVNFFDDVFGWTDSKQRYVVQVYDYHISVGRFTAYCEKFPRMDTSTCIGMRDFKSLSDLKSQIKDAVKHFI